MSSWSFENACHHGHSRMLVIVVIRECLSSWSFENACHRGHSRMLVIVVIRECLSSWSVENGCHHGHSRMLVIMVIREWMSSWSFKNACHHGHSRMHVIVVIRECLSSWSFENGCHRGHWISADEDASLWIESFAIINSRGVSTKLYFNFIQYCLIHSQNHTGENSRTQNLIKTHATNYIHTSNNVPADCN